MILNKHVIKQKGFIEIIITVCDNDLIGRSSEDFIISKRFYGGTEATGRKILSEARQASMVNILGKESVELFTRNNLVKEEEIKIIEGIPHAIIVSVEERYRNII